MKTDEKNVLEEKDDAALPDYDVQEILSFPARIQIILEIKRRGGISVQEVAKHFSMSLNNARHHLNILTLSGVLEANMRRDHQAKQLVTMFKLTGDGQKVLTQWVMNQLDFIFESLKEEDLRTALISVINQPSLINYIGGRDSTGRYLRSVVADEFPLGLRDGISQEDEKASNEKKKRNDDTGVTITNHGTFVRAKTENYRK